MPDLQTFFGVDPGRHGAIARLDYSVQSGTVRRASVWDMPTYQRPGSKRVFVDPKKVSEIFDRYPICPPGNVFLESVGGRPTDGSAAAFQFGCAYGVVLALVETHPDLQVHHVAPQEWQVLARLKKANNRTTKKMSVNRAMELFPEIVQAGELTPGQDGRADAILMAMAAVRVENDWYDPDARS
ncbi:MAG: hypothetical protein AAGF55_01115 [Pseudomonadota bacterium]